MDRSGEMNSPPSRTRRRIRRRVWVTIAVIAVALVVVVRSNATVLVNGASKVDSYTVVGDRTIEIRVAVAPRSWTRVTNVVETPSDVIVAIESLDWPIPVPRLGYLELRDLTVSLADDLGTRRVLDAEGGVVPAR